MDRVWIETLKLVWREEDAPLMTFDLCKEVLLLVVMCRCHIACGNTNVMCKADIKLYSRSWTTAVRTLPSMPMSRRLDVSCPQFLLACCLLIQFQLKPRKSTTIFFPTVSFKVCCRYTLEIHEERNIQSAWAAFFHNLRPKTSHNAAHFYYYKCVCCRISSCLQGVSVSSDHVLFKPRRTTWLWGSWAV